MRDILQAARDFLDHPSRWAHRGISTNAEGGHAPYDKADCLCVGAAILRFTPSPITAWAVMGHFIEAQGWVRQHGAEYGQIGTWNDAAGRTHAEIIAALDAAIETAPDSPMYATGQYDARHGNPRQQIDDPLYHQGYDDEG